MRLRIGGVPEHFNFPWHQVIDDGVCPGFTTELEFLTYHGGTGAMTRALVEREIDFAILLTEGCIASQLKGDPIQIVKTFVQSPLIWGIHVGHSSRFQSVDEIQGTRYAISRIGSGSHLMAIVDAAERGWPTEELKFVKVKNLAGARSALIENEADVFFWEKYTTQPDVNNGNFRRLGVRKTLWPAFVIAVHEEFLESQRQTVRQVLEVINQYCAALQSNPMAVKIIASRYDLAVEQTAEWFGLTEWSTDFERPLEALQTARDYLERLELVPISVRPTDSLWAGGQLNK